nr:MAG TPA: Protein of unknown function (DUF1642) [Caudoviricetes sp.]
MNKSQIMQLIDRMFEFGYTCPYETTKIFVREYEKLNKPEKVKIPKFVADFIAEQKKLGHTLSYSIDASMSDRVAEWYWDNSELFALAWIFGYEVEKEKRYFVKIRATKHCFAKDGKGRIFFSLTYKSCFTKTELEKTGFGWVFDCPGIEIEEVEDEV